VRYPDQVPVPPADQHLPGQEGGVRPARALPYTLHADGRLAGGAFRIDLRNAGRAAAVLQVRSAGDALPRSYTVEPGRQLSDSWDLQPGYDLAVHGPNGFYRGFTAGSAATDLGIAASYDEQRNKITLTIANRGPQPAVVTVRDGYTSRRTTLSLRPGQSGTRRWTLSPARGWYDLLVTVQGDPQFRYRYAGHLENGRDSISDPAMGGLVTARPGPDR
jgi:phospholipase C